jgi:hypothetical protein
MDTNNIDTVEDVPHINRVEVIDETGRAYVNMNVDRVQYSLQDGARTLKLFVTSEHK